MVDFTALGKTEEEMANELSRVKIKLFGKDGAVFLASILGQTEFVWDDTEDTAWTDGLKIGFNPHFFLSLPLESRITVLAHELWHIAYEHMIRLNGRDPENWNIAADHVINLYLQEKGFSFVGLEFTLKNPRYRNMGTDQVYSLLPKPPPCGSGGNGPPAPSGSGGNQKKPSLSSDLRSPPADKQIEVIGKVVQAVQAAQMAGLDPGTIPGEITLAVEKFLNPKLPWQFLLRRFFVEQNREDYSWKRPNRRHDEYLPSLWSEDGLTTINYYLDVSGSISDGDILRFNSEVKHIKEEFNPGLLNLITFDTHIRDEYQFTEDEPFEKIVVTGRGGTDLDPVAKHIIKTQPNVAVIFTDMYVDPMPPVGGIPVLWITVGNPNATVPFGEMVHIDKE